MMLVSNEHNDKELSPPAEKLLQRPTGNRACTIRRTNRSRTDMPTWQRLFPERLISSRACKDV